MNDVGKVKIISGLSSKERWSRIAFLCVTVAVLIIATICFINAIKWIDKPFPGFLLNQRMVTGGVGQYHWTGTKAGIKFPDKILKINNRVVSSLNDIEEVIKNTAVGSPIKYTVERDSQSIDITIPSMRFTLFDFLVIFGIYLFVGVAYLLIGVVVFILKPDTMVSWTLLLLCAFLSLYHIVSFDILSTHFGFLRIYFFVSALFPAAGIHLSLIFPEQKRCVQRWPYLQFIPYIISLLIIIPLEIFYPGPVFVKMYGLLFIYTILSVIGFLASIFSSYIKKSSILARQRAKVILFGAALAFPIPAFALLLSFTGRTLWGLQIQNNFFSIPVLSFPASIAYSITRHNLFDIDVYIKRALGYIIMTIIVGATYFFLQMSLSLFVFRPVFGINSERVFPFLYALLVVFLFNPLDRWIQGVVDKIFFRKGLDYKVTIGSVSNKLTSLLTLNEIIKQLKDTLKEEMFIDRVDVILFGPRKESSTTLFTDVGSQDMKHHNGQHIGYDDPLLALISREKKLITKFDIEEDPRYSAIKEACGKRFLEIGASLAIPLIYQGEVKGVITLGQKRSGYFYTREDIDLLMTLANQGIVAMENAKFFEQIKKEEARFRTLIQAAPSVIIYLSPECNIIEFNPEAERIYGCRRKEVVGQNFLELFIPFKERETIFSDFKKVLDGQQRRGYENSIINANGSKSFFTWNFKRLIDDSGRPLGMVAVGQDITERKKIEKALDARNHQQKMIAHLGHKVLLIDDLTDFMNEVARDVAKTLGNEYSNILELLSNGSVLLLRAGAGWKEEHIGHTIDHAGLDSLTSYTLKSKKPVIIEDLKSETHFSCPSFLHEHKVISGMSVKIQGHNGPWGVLGTFTTKHRIFSEDDVNFLKSVANLLADAIGHKQAEEKIHQLAFYDSLTGLPNRVIYKDHLALETAHAKRNGNILAVMFLDLDRFKHINDTLGHSMGDSVLKVVAERLINTVRSGDTITRQGGDEFTMLLPGITKIADVSEMANKILEAVRQPVTLGIHEPHMTASIGIALYPYDGEDPETLLKNADIAMYHAKEEGKDNFQFYRSHLKTNAYDQMALVSGLRQALKHKEFVVYYQPQLDIISGRIVGMEALVRWQHPDRGTVYPDEFINIAEQTRLIVPLGIEVLETACEQIKVWHNAGFTHLRVAVNLSAHQFQQQNLIEIVKQVLQETGLEPNFLELEVTERTSMKNVETAAYKMKKLVDLGVHMTIDDLGTGFCSLNYLKKFPINTLKIDRSFVQDVISNANDAAIIMAIISMAKNMKLKVVAEGVETKEQLDFLKQKQCNEIQGFLFSEPVSAEKFEQILVQDKHLYH